MAEEQTIRVACPNCNAFFELSSELMGQSGECTECGSVFNIIPATDLFAPDKASDEQDEAPLAQEEVPAKEADDAVPMKSQEETGATNTVKLSRMKVGMVPKINDEFSLGLVQSVNNNPTASKTNNRRMIASGTRQPQPRPPLQPQTEKSFWSKLMFWKKS